jgi:hypothetical protein
MSKDMRCEFVQKVLLKHCDCGIPEESLKYIQKILNLLNDSEPQYFEDLSIFFYHDEGLKYTIYYMLHKYGLTEHNESVPGRLTESGYELLKELNNLYPRN